MNRKEKRKFNKLYQAEKAQIIEAELNQKVSKVMAQEIAKAMINGMNILYGRLYEDFVMQIDAAESEKEWEEKVGELLSAIRIEYLRIEANKEKENLNEIP